MHHTDSTSKKSMLMKKDETSGAAGAKVMCVLEMPCYLFGNDSWESELRHEDIVLTRTNGLCI